MSLLPCESNQESVAPGLAPCEWQWKVNDLSAESGPGSAWNISTSNGGTEIYFQLREQLNESKIHSQTNLQTHKLTNTQQYITLYEMHQLPMTLHGSI